MGEAGNEATIQHYMSSPNRWSTGGGESKIVTASKAYDKEESVGVGRVFATC